VLLYLLTCRLVPRFEALLKKAVSADVPLRVAVVGAGAAGVELACAVKYRWVSGYPCRLALLRVRQRCKLLGTKAGHRAGTP